MCSFLPSAGVWLAIGWSMLVPHTFYRKSISLFPPILASAWMLPRRFQESTPGPAGTHSLISLSSFWLFSWFQLSYFSAPIFSTPISPACCWSYFCSLQAAPLFLSQSLEIHHSSTFRSLRLLLLHGASPVSSQSRDLAVMIWPRMIIVDPAKSISFGWTSYSNFLVALFAFATRLSPAAALVAPGFSAGIRSGCFFIVPGWFLSQVRANVCLPLLRFYST